MKLHTPNSSPTLQSSKKKNGKQRICIDFTYLNMDCPNDIFHVLILISSQRLRPVTNSYLSWIYSWAIRKQDEPQGSRENNVHTDRGTYCYKVIHFGLKSPGATYQKLLNKMFANQLKAMEVYLNNILVMSNN